MSAAVAGGYRHQDVKISIKAETSDKCAYCESKITHVYWGDIEHIYPVDARPELRFDYGNLTLSCAPCNNYKGAYYNPQAPIVHPYTDDPADHLVGLGTLVWQRNGSEVGQRTITLLRLNRPTLCEQRMERLAARGESQFSQVDVREGIARDPQPLES